MNYQLQLRTPESNLTLVFHAIVFDSFKVNVIERYTGKGTKLCEVVLKVRTLDDQIVHRKDGFIKIKLKDEDFEMYKNLTRTLTFYDYKNKLINRNKADEDFVHFLLRIVIINYDFN